ncbi:MAG TPA: hypothetical protein VJR89_11140, partial [Polyangiales bacterium]|nr:hypothetical protein [Polyangiales bacterium]
TQGGSEPVAAKYRRLMADAMRRWSAQAEPTAHLPKRASTAEFSKQWTTCESSNQRAQIALCAVLEESAARSGALFGVRGGALQLLAISGPHDASELERLATEQWTQALSPNAQTAYADVQQAAVHKALPLTTAERDRMLLVGIVVLADRPADRPLPWMLLQTVSRALLDSHDVQPIALPDV